MSRFNRVDYPSAEEIAATIRHSAIPAIVTEGADDVLVLRKLEDEFVGMNLSIIPAGGREVVLRLFQMRASFGDKTDVMFIADRDTWVLSDIPVQFRSSQLLFTDGYSIENDMFRDGSLENLLRQEQRDVYMSELAIVCRWYALATSRWLAGRQGRLGVHPNEVLDNPERRDALMALEEGEIYPDLLYDQLLGNYSKLLRGKTLFALLLRHAISFNPKSLLQMGIARRGGHYMKLVDDIRSYMSGRNLAATVQPD